LESKGRLLPIEVKFQRPKSLKIQVGLRIFLKKMGLQHAVVVADETLEKRPMDNEQVIIVPLVLWGMI